MNLRYALVQVTRLSDSPQTKHRVLVLGGGGMRKLTKAKEEASRVVGGGSQAIEIIDAGILELGDDGIASLKLDGPA